MKGIRKPSKRGVRSALAADYFLRAAELTSAERARLHPILWWDFAEYGFPKPDAATLQAKPPDVPRERLQELLVNCGYKCKTAAVRVAIGDNERKHELIWRERRLRERRGNNVQAASAS